MSIQMAKEYVARFVEDEDFARRVTAAEDAVARRKLVEEEGFRFSKREIDSVAAELSPEELSEITRGPWVGSMCECGREGMFGCAVIHR